MSHSSLKLYFFNNANILLTSVFYYYTCINGHVICFDKLLMLAFQYDVYMGKKIVVGNSVWVSPTIIQKYSPYGKVA